MSYDADLRVVARNLLEHGRHCAAGTAPRRPEVHDGGLVALQHLGVVGGVGDFGQCTHG
jgi:hypothetical protein